MAAPDMSHLAPRLAIAAKCVKLQLGQLFSSAAPADGAEGGPVDGNDGSSPMPNSSVVNLFTCSVSRYRYNRYVAHLLLQTCYALSSVMPHENMLNCTKRY